MIASKLRVGIAGCAIAAAASLTSVAPAQAAPVAVPAAPVILGSADVPLSGWWNFPKSSDLLGGFKLFPGSIPSHGSIFTKLFHFGCYGKHGF
jgi:hypothetical protein